MLNDSGPERGKSSLGPHPNTRAGVCSVSLLQGSVSLRPADPSDPATDFTAILPDAWADFCCTPQMLVPPSFFTCADDLWVMVTHGRLCRGGCHFFGSGRERLEGSLRCFGRQVALDF